MHPGNPLPRQILQMFDINILLHTRLVGALPTVEVHQEIAVKARHHHSHVVILQAVMMVAENLIHGYLNLDLQRLDQIHGPLKSQQADHEVQKNIGAYRVEAIVEAEVTATLIAEVLAVTVIAAEEVQFFHGLDHLLYPEVEVLQVSLIGVVLPEEMNLQDQLAQAAKSDDSVKMKNCLSDSF